MKFSCSFLFLLAASNLVGVTATETRRNNLRQQRVGDRKLYHEGYNPSPYDYPYAPPPGHVDHNPYHNPYQNPYFLVTDRPTPHPTPRPTPDPTPLPTFKPTTAQPSVREPTSSPSLAPTPINRSDLTLAQTVCADENVDTLGLLCALITASPAIFDILDDKIFVDLSELTEIPGFDISNIQSPVGFPNRGLQASNRLLTAFAPTNNALSALIKVTVQQFFDANNEEVAVYFESIEIDLANGAIFEEFILTPEGSFVRNEILLTHVVGREISDSDLSCQQTVNMLSGQPTLTDCVDGKKFQIGLRNTFADKPEIISANIFAANGVAHIINGVIIPNLNVPELSESPSEPPSLFPTESLEPSETPSESMEPSESPSISFEPSDSGEPSASPSSSLEPSDSPSESLVPSASPSATPSAGPSVTPSVSPSEAPTASPSKSLNPSASPSRAPNSAPSSIPSSTPSSVPSSTPSSVPSSSPSSVPSSTPSSAPSSVPSIAPSSAPSSAPTFEPTTRSLTFNPFVSNKTTIDDALDDLDGFNNIDIIFPPVATVAREFEICSNITCSGLTYENDDSCTINRTTITDVDKIITAELGFILDPADVDTGDDCCNKKSCIGAFIDTDTRTVTQTGGIFSYNIRVEAAKNEPNNTWYDVGVGLYKNDTIAEFKVFRGSSDEKIDFDDSFVIDAGQADIYFLRFFFGSYDFGSDSELAVKVKVRNTKYLPTSTDAPTSAPTTSSAPTEAPSEAPSEAPTIGPTKAPTKSPTRAPTKSPTRAPTGQPTPQTGGTEAPTKNPTREPTKNPTKEPTRNPTKEPTRNPTKEPTKNPTREPTKNPTKEPTKNPTGAPTDASTPPPTTRKVAFGSNETDLSTAADAFNNAVSGQNFPVIFKDNSLEDSSETKCVNINCPVLETAPSCAGSSTVTTDEDNVDAIVGVLDFTVEPSVLFGSDCCRPQSSCIGAYIDTDTRTVTASGGEFTYGIRVEKAKGDNVNTWYEVAAALYIKGDNDTIADFKLFRGSSNAVSTFDESFVIAAGQADDYFVRFFLGSYDRIKDGALSAQVKVRNVKYKPENSP